MRLIAAVARNGVMGKGGKLPWSIPEDPREERGEGRVGRPELGAQQTEHEGTASDLRRRIADARRMERRAWHGEMSGERGGEKAVRL